MIEIRIDGEPVPKGRPRFNTKTGNVYTPKATTDAEARIGQAARYQNVGIDLPMNGALAVTLCFFSSVKPKNGKLAGRLPDTDNLLKTCLDGMNTVVFHDDAQVTEIHAYIERGSDNPGTYIRVEQLADAERDQDAA